MTKYLLKVQLKVSQIPHNFFGPSAQIGQSFGMFLKKVLITYPWFEQVVYSRLRNRYRPYVLLILDFFPGPTALLKALCLLIFGIFSRPYYFIRKGESTFLCNI